MGAGLWLSDPVLSLQRLYQAMHLSVKSPSKAPLLWARIGNPMSKTSPTQDCATLTGSSAVTTTMGITVPGCARSAMTSSDTMCASQTAACPACPVGLGNTVISVSSQAPTGMERRGFPPRKYYILVAASLRVGLCYLQVGPQSQLGML